MLDEEKDTIEDVTNEEPTTADPEPYADDLDGLPDDVKAEVISEMKATEPEKPEPKEDTKEDTPTAEADSDNKQYESIEKPKGRIPYERFKQQLDKTKELEAEIERLKSMQNTQQVQQPSQTVQQPAPNNGMKLDKEVFSKMEQAAQMTAKEMLGWTDDDVAALDYADESDEKAVLWRQALGLARGNIQSQVRHEISRQQQYQQQLQQKQSEVVRDFNAFYAEKSQAPDFKDVQKHARETYFAKLSPMEQTAISEAYNRIERNVGSPADAYCIKNYFLQAEQDYHSQTQTTTPLAKKDNKFKQAEKLPRAGQVSGIATPEGVALSAENIQHMLDTEDWDNIPDNVKDMLLNASMRDN